MLHTNHWHSLVERTVLFLDHHRSQSELLGLQRLGVLLRQRSLARLHRHLAGGLLESDGEKSDEQ